MSGKVPLGVVFSLVCERCDAGMEIETYEQAMDLRKMASGGLV